MKLKRTMARGFTPMSDAAWRSCATARNARPARVRDWNSSSAMTSESVTSTSKMSLGPIATSETTEPFHPKIDRTRSGSVWPVSLICFETISCTTIAAANVVTSQPILVTGSNWPSGSIATKSNKSPTSAVATRTSNKTTRIGTLPIEHPRVHPPAQVSADDYERSLREVDDPRRGEDQAVSDGDERVDRADRRACT